MVPDQNAITAPLPADANKAAASHAADSGTRMAPIELSPGTPLIKVLLIDDDRGEFLLTRKLLSKIERQRYRLDWVATYLEGQAALSGTEYDLFLLDYRLGDRSGMELLREAKTAGQIAPIILLTGQGDHHTDLEAMRAGAADYLVKGELNAALLERSIRYALERARTIQVLRESDSRYRSLVETSPDAIICTDLTGKIILCNQKSVQSQGAKSVLELLGRNFFDLVAPEDRDRVKPLIEIALAQGVTRNLEFCMIRADGTRYHVESGSSRIAGAAEGTKAVIFILRDVTERKLADAMLRKLSRAVEQTADHLVITDRNGVIEYVNPAFEQLTGYSLEEVVGKTPRILRSDRHDQKFFKKLWSTILSGHVFRTIFTNRKKNGELYFQEETITPITDGNGKITHFVSTGHDITQRKQAEEALRQTEAQYRSIFENAIEGIYQASLDGRFLTVNPALVRMLGCESDAELINCAVEQFYLNPSTRANFSRQIQQQNVVSSFEAEVLRKDGKTIWISENARAVRNLQGEIEYYEGTVENITQRKQAEQDMLRLAAFPQWNPNPVLEFSANGDLTYFNQAAQLMANSLGLDHPLAMLPDNAAVMVRECHLSGQSIIQREIPIGSRTLCWSFFPIPVNRVIHCYVEDATERLDLESRLRHSQKMESIGQLAAGVAHDFNNLLTIIQGQACLVLAHTKLERRAENALSQIVTAAERAANLTRQLLAFSRRQPMQSQPINLNEAIHNLAKMLQRILGDDITLEFNLNQELSPVVADVGMMEQVIMNLVVNARDAMPKGGRLIFRTANLLISDAYVKNHPEAEPGHCVCVSITDTGCGMDEFVLARLFEPFFTTKEIGKGTGLGLATVYGIIKQHQGWLEVESQVSRGSTFKVFIPADPRATPAPTEQFLPPKYQRGHETILVVEDEASLRELIQEILGALGYQVVLAASGVAALEWWRQKGEPIDLLLTDMVMPDGVSGKELAVQLLAEMPDLKVVFISGYSVDLSTPEMSFREGMNFLQKPFSPATLARAVRDCLDSSPSAD
jgi:two-component system, cell cycle sensor histidine kinase and response regulator CckA